MKPIINPAKSPVMKSPQYKSNVVKKHATSPAATEIKILITVEKFASVMMTMYVKIEILVNPIKQNDILLRRYPEKKHICLKSTILSKQN